MTTGDRLFRAQAGGDKCAKFENPRRRVLPGLTVLRVDLARV